MPVFSEITLITILFASEIPKHRSTAALQNLSTHLLFRGASTEHLFLGINIIFKKRKATKQRKETRDTWVLQPAD